MYIVKWPFWVVKKCLNWTFKANFLSRPNNFFFISFYHFKGTIFVSWLFKSVYFLKLYPIFNGWVLCQYTKFLAKHYLILYTSLGNLKSPVCHAINERLFSAKIFLSLLIQFSFSKKTTQSWRNPRLDLTFAL